METILLIWWLFGISVGVLLERKSNREKRKNDQLPSMASLWLVFYLSSFVAILAWMVNRG